MFFCATLTAQNPVSFRHISIQNGLSQTSVFAITQDQEGFMWFGTRDGLNKYDGYHFKIFKNGISPNSLIANDIRILYFDRLTQDLWVGTIAGLSRYRATADNFTNYTSAGEHASGLSSDVIRTIYRDSRNRLWVGTAEGLNLYEDAQDQFREIPLEVKDDSGPMNRDITTILEDSKGALWIGTERGLYELIEGNTYSFRSLAIPENEELFVNLHIKALLEDDDHKYWIGTHEAGVYCWDQKTNQIRIFQHEKNDPGSLSHNNIRTLNRDKDGQIWIGTFDGLNLFDRQTQSFIKHQKMDLIVPGLSDNSVRSVFVDERGSLWIGTYYGGINYLDVDNSRFTNYSYKPYQNSLSANVVSSFAEDENGHLWIGTEGGGLNFYNQNTGQFQHFKYQAGQENSLSGNNVKQLLLDQNQLWIGTFQEGLNLLEISSGQFQHFKHDPENPNSLADNNVYGLHKEGENLWILTYGGGLDIYNISEKRFYNFSNQPDQAGTLSSDLTRVFLKSTDGTIWIGTEKGVNKTRRGQNGFPESFEVFLPDEKIYTLQEDHQSNIWIGTISNGLYGLHPGNGQTKHYTTEDGLPGNTVFGILEDQDHNLWLSTNKGLSKFDPAELKFTNYGYANGLENLEYNFNAYYKTRHGDFLFGGIQGFTRFNPETIQPNNYIPPIAFTSLKLNNKLVPVGDEKGLLPHSINETNAITFAYNEANFSIGFAALDYFSPENNHYAFMLEGIDRDWNYSLGESEATYTIQRPGNYTFRLKGGNSDGLWNQEERQLEIIVLPPPWRSWWAYLIYALVLSGLVYSLIRFIRLRHKLQLEQVAKQQQKELHEVKLRFFTNITHEFRTPLTLILGPLKELIGQAEDGKEEKSKLISVERNAQRLLNLVNQILTFRKLETDHEPMQVIQGDMVTFLQEIFLSFQESARSRNIVYRFEVDSGPIIAWYDPDKLEKVFFNLLSNAFKFTPNAGTIKMGIKKKEQQIEITVQDTGAGINPELHEQIFKRFYEKASAEQSNIKGSGIGLAISKQLIALHHGAIFVISEVGQGATFGVQLPLGREHFAPEQIVKNFQDGERITSYHQELVPASSPVIAENPPEPASAQAPLLLIIEDNPEIRNYIQYQFKGVYRMITAGDGQEGLEKARKVLPDLIICDVMMPIMDGITMCGELKKDLEISHIPIILLTARTAELFKIEGLETGADDYITKPFNPEELRLRVRNLIEARRQLRNKFSRVFALEPKEITLTSADEKFLEKAMQIVEKHIGNTEFGIEQFAFELAVSRPLLFTKLKVLTDQTPNNFIKTIRLKRAAQLLTQQKINISEIAYLVGFRDPKYFRKCFQKQFDTSPSDFAQTQTPSMNLYSKSPKKP